MKRELQIALLELLRKLPLEKQITIYFMMKGAAFAAKQNEKSA